MENNPDCTTLCAQAVLARTLGPMVIGIWIQQIFLGIVLTQATRFYMVLNGHAGHGIHRCIVVALLVLNVLGASIDLDALYRTVVSPSGDDIFEFQTWTTWADPVVTAVVVFLAQCLLLERCFHAIKSWTIFSLLIFLATLSLGSGLAVTITFVQRKAFGPPVNQSIATVLWIVSTAAANMVISAILFAEQLKKKTSFRPPKVVNNLMQSALEINLATSVTAILSLVLYFALKNTTFYLLSQYSLPRVATITVLASLLQREDLHNGTKSGSSFTLCSAIQERTTNRLEVKVNTVVESDNNDIADGSVETVNRAESKAAWPNSV
ncbi:hypothetical protein DFH06DRAFT_1319903 [Mycena polygramma]|nr:hypothetical protein DFH06DRAFT_1319903 [Mycena polygramma]